MRPLAVLARQRPCEHRKLHFDRLVDVARRAIDDDARDAARLGADRKKSAPASRFDAGSLLDDDNIVRPAGLDCGRAKMSRRTALRQRQCRA